MLVITRKLHEKVNIGPDIVIQVVQIRGDRVRLGVLAPRNVVVLRPDAKNKEPRERKPLTQED